METMSQANPAPICGSCGHTMSDRQDRGWFCPSCVEYDKHLLTIYPGRPGHPAFYDGLEDDPERLVGRTIELSPYGTVDTEYIGEVTDVSGSRHGPVLTIKSEPSDPFIYQESVIHLKRLMNILQPVRDPIHPKRPVEDKLVIQII